jgi:hypothetical protein
MAPEVAHRVYAGLSRSGEVHAAMAAESLHHALLDLRATQQPLVWAAYCHTGA